MNGIRKTQGTVVLVLMAVIYILSVLEYHHFGLANVDRVGIFDVGFNVISMLASIILFLCCMLDGMQRSESRQFFMSALFFNYTAMALDSFSYFIVGDAGYYNFAVFSMLWVYASDCVIAFLVLSYIISSLELGEVPRVRLLRRVYLAGAVCGVLMALSNLYYPLYYHIDLEHGLTYSGTYELNYLYTILTALAIMVLVFRRRSTLEKDQRIAAGGYALASLVLIVFAEFIPNFYINYAATFLLLLWMYMLLGIKSANKSALVELELDAAKRIQGGILPDIAPEFEGVPEFGLFAKMKPADEVGGDFYDFFMRDEDHLVFVTGDVLSLGVGAAMFMAVVKTMINMRAQSGGTPAEILSDVNRGIFETNREGLAAAVWLGILDLRTGRLLFANAGQEPAAVLRRENGGSYAYDNAAADPPLGRKKDHPYSTREIRLDSGERIFLYADGVVNSAAMGGRGSGPKQLISTLNKNRTETDKALCSLIFSLAADDDKRPQEDDITVLSLTLKKKKTEGSL